MYAVQNAVYTNNKTTSNIGYFFSLNTSILHYAQDTSLFTALIFPVVQFTHELNQPLICILHYLVFSISM